MRQFRYEQLSIAQYDLTHPTNAIGYCVEIKIFKTKVIQNDKNIVE
ncbi:MAG: hypothetical protein HC941_10515 [Microcoleus sp. SU_5_3]|nr:hypothetical protein [Microcoleus sp. SU_5_3]